MAQAFGAVRRVTVPNEIPLPLWHLGPELNWNETIPPLIQKLEDILQKYAAHKSTVISETELNICDHGVELAISASIGSRFISVTMLISEDTIQKGWTSQLLCSAGKFGASDSQSCESQSCGILTNKAQEVACRALLYSGMLTALKSQDIRASFAIGINLRSRFLHEQDFDALVLLHKFQMACIISFCPENLDVTLNPSVVRQQHDAAEIYEAVGDFDSAAKCYELCVSAMKKQDDNSVIHGGSISTCLSSKVFFCHLICSQY